MSTARNKESMTNPQATASSDLSSQSPHRIQYGVAAVKPLRLNSLAAAYPAKLGPASARNMVPVTVERPVQVQRRVLVEISVPVEEVAKSVEVVLPQVVRTLEVPVQVEVVSGANSPETSAEPDLDPDLGHFLPGLSPCRRMGDRSLASWTGGELHIRTAENEVMENLEAHNANATSLTSMPINIEVDPKLVTVEVIASPSLYAGTVVAAPVEAPPCDMPQSMEGAKGGGQSITTACPRVGHQEARSPIVSHTSVAKEFEVTMTTDAVVGNFAAGVSPVITQMLEERSARLQVDGPIIVCHEPQVNTEQSQPSCVQSAAVLSAVQSTPVTLIHEGSVDTTASEAVESPELWTSSCAADNTDVSSSVLIPELGRWSPHVPSTGSDRFLDLDISHPAISVSGASEAETVPEWTELAQVETSVVAPIAGSCIFRDIDLEGSCIFRGIELEVAPVEGSSIIFGSTAEPSPTGAAPTIHVEAVSTGPSALPQYLTQPASRRAIEEATCTIDAIRAQIDAALAFGVEHAADTAVTSFVGLMEEESPPGSVAGFAAEPTIVFNNYPATMDAMAVGGVEMDTPVAVSCQSSSGVSRATSSDAIAVSGSLVQTLDCNATAVLSNRSAAPVYVVGGDELRPRVVVASPAPTQVALPSQITSHYSDIPTRSLSRPAGPPVVAVDVDEVLCAYLQGFQNFLRREQYQGPVDRLSSFNEAYNARSPWRTKFVMAGGLDTLEAVPGAMSAIWALKQAGIRLEAVTSRPRSVKQRTEALLSKLFGKGTISAVHCIDSGSKGVACQEINAVALIDDQITHCIDAAERGLIAVLFNLHGEYPWSASEAEARAAGVQRIDTWSGVCDFLLSQLQVAASDPVSRQKCEWALQYEEARRRAQVGSCSSLRTSMLGTTDVLPCRSAVVAT